MGRVLAAGLSEVDAPQVGAKEEKAPRSELSLSRVLGFAVARVRGRMESTGAPRASVQMAGGTWG
jgi:hypothetical protein